MEIINNNSQKLEETKGGYLKNFSLIDTRDQIEGILKFDVYLKSIQDFFEKKGWQHKGNVYYKSDCKINIDHREIIKPKNNYCINNILKTIDKIFMNCTKENILVINPKELDTFFVVAGIQNISKTLFNELSYDENWHYINQPVIRIKYLDDISGEQGNGISFVNTTIYKIGSSIDDFLIKLDYIIDFLSAIGLYAGNISFKIRQDSPIWNNKEMKNLIIEIYYGNLQIGDAVFIYDFEQEKRGNLTIADIGIGLERIIYARNRYNNYFEQFGSFLERYTEQEIEIIKTIILILISKEGNLSKDQNNQFKKLFTKLDKNKNYYPLMQEMYNYWAVFHCDIKGNIEKTIINFLKLIETI